MKNTTSWAVRGWSRLLVLVMALLVGLSPAGQSVAQSIDPVARGLAARANTGAGVASASRSGVRTSFFTVATPTTTEAALASALQRWTVRLPRDTARWRIRVANAVPYGATLGTADVTLTDLYLGEPEVIKTAGSTAGNLTGGFSAAPALAVPSAALGAAGARYVSGWVTNSALQLAAGKLYMMSLGYTTPATGTQASGGGAAVFFKSGGAAEAGLQTAPSGIASTNSVKLDIIVEYEFKGGLTTPVYVALGDSNNRGLGDNSAAGNRIFHHQTYHQVLSQRLGVPIIEIGASGYTFTQFMAANSGMYTRFGASLSMDGAVIECGTNEFGGNQAETTVRNKLLTTIDTLKGFGAANFLVMTIPPRVAIAGSNVTGYSYRSALTVAANIGDTSITTSDRVVVGSTSDGTAQTYVGSESSTDIELRAATSISTGSGPYTTTVPALGKAHPIGAIVETVGEYQRRLYNTWLKALPGGINAVVDADEALRDPSDVYRLLNAYRADAGLHWNSTGQAKLGSIITIPTVPN